MTTCLFIPFSPPNGHCLRMMRTDTRPDHRSKGELHGQTMIPHGIACQSTSRKRRRLIPPPTARRFYHANTGEFSLSDVDMEDDTSDNTEIPRPQHLSPDRPHIQRAAPPTAPSLPISPATEITVQTVRDTRSEPPTPKTHHVTTYITQLKK